MSTFTSELIQVADAVAREKDVPREAVVQAMEHAIEVAARKKYGYELKIRAHIDPVSGIQLFREREVVPDAFAEGKEAYQSVMQHQPRPVPVHTPFSFKKEREQVVESVPPVEEGEPVFDHFRQIPLSEALSKKKDAKVGEIISDPLPPIDLGRVAAQTAKQVIIQKVRDAERERQYEEYKDRVGEIVNGIVKRVDYGNVVVGLGQSTEAILLRDQVIKGEAFKVNDRVRSYLRDVRREQKGYQIFLSRTAPEFMAKLFAQEVPEIYDGIIEIKGVAREPGSRAKIAVFSHEANVDPVGSCVGVRGARVQAITNELQGEKIDIIPYSADPATFVVNALAQAEVSKVVLDEENHRIEVVVPEDQLSLAIGRRGQNVRLASELSGWRIDVLTDEQESKRRVEEFNTLSQLFIKALDVEEVIAHLLVTEGFASVEDVAYVPVEDLASIQGFDADIAEELRNRAKEYLAEEEKNLTAESQALGVNEELKQLPHVSLALMIALGKQDIKTIEAVADLSRDEFRELVPDTTLTDGDIDTLIMQAREKAYKV